MTTVPVPAPAAAAGARLRTARVLLLVLYAVAVVAGLLAGQVLASAVVLLGVAGQESVRLLHRSAP